MDTNDLIASLHTSVSGPAAPAAATDNSQAYTMGGMTAFLGLLQGFTQYQTGQYNSKLERWNARVAELQAKSAIAAGEDDASRTRRDAAATKGTQRAGFAAQGVRVDSGTAADVQAQTDLIAGHDIATIRRNAQLTAWGFRVQAADHRLSGALAKSEGTTRAVGSILTGGAAGVERGYKLWRS